MKQFFYIILVFVLGLFFSACGNNANLEMNTGLETTRDNTTLKCDSLFVLDNWIEKFKNAKPKHTELIDTFKTINAIFKIESNTLYLDENNSIILSACIKLVKGSKNFEFHGYVHRDQFNQQNNDNVKTFTIASIDYTTKQGDGLKSELRDYTIYSDGRIEKLEPTNKRTYFKLLWLLTTWGFVQ